MNKTAGDVLTECYFLFLCVAWDVLGCYIGSSIFGGFYCGRLGAEAVVCVMVCGVAIKSLISRRFRSDKIDSDHVAA